MPSSTAVYSVTEFRSHVWRFSYAHKAPVCHGLRRATLATASVPARLLAERRGGEAFAPGNLGAAAQGLLNIQTFQNLVGETFTMFVEDFGVTYLRLLRVKDLNQAQSDSSSASDLNAAQLVSSQGRLATPKVAAPRKQGAVPLTRFTLTFANTGSAFTQDTFLLDHGRLGRFALFVVPSSPAICNVTFCLLPNALQPSVIVPALPSRASIAN